MGTCLNNETIKFGFRKGSSNSESCYIIFAMNVSTQLSAFVLLFSAIVAIMCLFERKRTGVALAFVIWLVALGCAKGGYVFNKLTGEGHLVTAIGYLALFAATPTLAIVAAEKKTKSFILLWLVALLLLIPLIYPFGLPLVDSKLLFRATSYRAVGLALFALTIFFAIWILQKSLGKKILPLTIFAAFAALLAIIEALWPWKILFPPVGTALSIVTLFMAYQILVRGEPFGTRMLVRAIAFCATALLLAALYGVLVYGLGNRPALFIINTLAASFAVLLLYEPIMGWIERQAARLFEQKQGKIQRISGQILSGIERSTNINEVADALFPMLSFGTLGFEVQTPSAKTFRGTRAGKEHSIPLDEQGAFSLKAWLDRRGESEAVRLVENIKGQLRYKLEIIELAKRLVQEEKMAAIGALASGLAHQLKNPLSALRATIELERTDESDELIKSQAERINVIISRFFDFAKPLELKREVVDIAKLLKAIVEHVKKLPENRALKIDLLQELDAKESEKFELFSPKEVKASVDAELLQEALINLIKNAISATENRGPVRIKTNSRGQTVFVEIEDSGKGIPPVEREKVFEPFYTKSKGGTGLGLAITKKIVESHGGTIRVEDSELGGARFVVELKSGEE